LRNFSREEFFKSALKIFVSLFLVVRHLFPPRFAGRWREPYRESLFGGQMRIPA
jgi:hypothetical protein